MNDFNAPKILWRKLLQRLLESSCSGRLSNYRRGSAKILNQGITSIGRRRHWKAEIRKIKFLSKFEDFCFSWSSDLHHDQGIAFSIAMHFGENVLATSFEINLWLIAKSDRAISAEEDVLWHWLTLVDSLANVRRWVFLQPWETLACPCQTSQTIRTLCKPQQLPVFNALQPLQRLKLCFLQKNLQLAPLLNCFHCLWHVYLHVHNLSRKKREIGTQCALQCSSEWFWEAALPTAGARRWWCCWSHLWWRRGPLLSTEIYSPTKSASFRCPNLVRALCEGLVMKICNPESYH